MDSRWARFVTFEEFNSIVPGITFGDWSLIPLRTEPYISFNYLVLNNGELDINALGF
jgi:hypothetical protein